jgi:hypothetical protein
MLPFVICDSCNAYEVAKREGSPSKTPSLKSILKQENYLGSLYHTSPVKQKKPLKQTHKKEGPLETKLYYYMERG